MYSKKKFARAAVANPPRKIFVGVYVSKNSPRQIISNYSLLNEDEILNNDIQLPHGLHNRDINPSQFN